MNEIIIIYTSMAFVIILFAIAVVVYFIVKYALNQKSMQELQHENLKQNNELATWRSMIVMMMGLMQNTSGVKHAVKRISDVSLSEREIEIAKYYAGEGRSRKWIAETLYMSPHTVKNHLTNIFEKTGAKGKGKIYLGNYLRERGLI